jgi:hypothetical protein
VYDARRKLVGKRSTPLLGVPRGDSAGMLKQFRKNCEVLRRASRHAKIHVERRMNGGQWIDCGIFLD